jgi:sporulation protein YlmC with PRC-barrel domain
MSGTQSVYTKTYTSFSGADIMATFNGKVVGELQAITYSVTREKAPIYVMGDPNPKSFSRGKRGIAGSLVFTVFDRDALHTMKTTDNPVYREGLNSTFTKTDAQGNQIFDPTQLVNVGDINMGQDDIPGQWAQKKAPKYSDEIPPFDVTINFLNEYGQSSKMTIYGVEILNEGMGLSVDDITTEKACTFIARGIDDMVSDAYPEPWNS